jgi:hypothetical protein
VDAGVIHRGDNFSGHSPVYLKLTTDKLPKKPIVPRQYYPSSVADKGKHAAKIYKSRKFLPSITSDLKIHKKVY